jgi:hypothetical protein
MLSILCLCAFIITFFAPIQTHASDPWGALLVSQALLEHGKVSLEDYSIADALTYRTLTRDHRIYYNYPLGTSLVALPAIWIANQFGFDMAQPEHDAVLQNLLASLTVGLTCALWYLLALRFVGWRAALVLAATFTFGTSVVSTMGSALWSFNLSLIFTLAALILIVPAQDDELRIHRALAVGGLLIVAYITRPTAMAAAVALGSYLLMFGRWRSIIWVGAAALGAVLCFSGFALIFYGEPIPPYYLGQREDGFGFVPAHLPASFYGLFFSPGRGLLVFSPFLLLVLAAILCWPQIWRQRLLWLAVIWFGLHTVALLTWRHWWGGASFGPRLFTDALPALFLITILAWQATATRSVRVQRIAGAVFACLALVSIASHTIQGAYQPATVEHHFVGFHTIEEMPVALFDWRYPQFFSTPTTTEARQEFYRVNPPLPNTLWGEQIFTVKYLRSNKMWHPDDVTLSPDLAILFNGTLMVYAPLWNARLLFDQEVFWIISDTAQPATMRMILRPVDLSWPLVLTVNEAEPLIVNTTTRTNITLYLQLQKGANRIHLQLLGCRPKALTTYGDTRLVASLHNLQVTTHSDP